MSSPLGQSSRALLRAIHEARDGATVAFLHKEDTEYFRRLTRHLAYVSGVSCVKSYLARNGLEINSAGEIWYCKTEAGYVGALRQQIKHGIIIDHRLAMELQDAA